jgi:aldose 1-epimerase
MTLSGDQYEISAGPYAAIVTEQGASLRALAHDGRPLILSHDPDEPPPAAAGQLLAPWPNRIDHGRYSFDGEAHVLPINEGALDNAIHGLVRFAPWRVAGHERHRVTLTHRLLGDSGYPFRLDLAVEYALDPDGGLTVRQSARNAGTPSPSATRGTSRAPRTTSGLRGGSAAPRSTTPTPRWSATATAARGCGSATANAPWPCGPARVIRGWRSTPATR